MNTDSRMIHRAVSILFLSGGLLGLALTVFSIFSLFLLEAALSFVIFGFVTIVGWQALNQNPRVVKWVPILLAAQIPLIDGQLFHYRFFTGISLGVMGGREVFEADFHFGAGFGIGLGANIYDSSPVVFGINFVALALFVAWVGRSQETQPFQLWKKTVLYFCGLGIVVAMITELGQFIFPDRVVAAYFSLFTEAGPQNKESEAIGSIQFVKVPAGEFILGSTFSGNGWPMQIVDLDEFWMMEEEVTIAQFEKFIEAGGYQNENYWSEEGWNWNKEQRLPGPRCLNTDIALDLAQQTTPIACVSWYEATAYANWLSEETGYRMRLPSNLEWEKSARGPNGQRYTWGNSRPDYDLVEYVVKADERVVGTYVHDESPYGIMNLNGSVYEWTDSHFYYNFQDVLLEEDSGPSSAFVSGSVAMGGLDWDRAVRGGNFSPERKSSLTLDRRDKVLKNVRTGGLGFRLVFSPEETG